VSELLPLLSPVLTRREAKAVRRKSIAFPLFIPDLGRGVVNILVCGSGPDVLAAELNRLSVLGSANAAALLTFLDCRGGVGRSEYAAAALERCSSAASAGNAYAQYVMSCVNRKIGKHQEAFRCLKSAMAGKFLPAFIDYARLGASGRGATSRHHKAALKILRAAHKLGHRLALVFIARSWLSGKAGWLERLAGLPLFLFAILRAAGYAARHPLSEKIFVLPPSKESLLRELRT
jgi:hypothetical protein